MQEFLWYPFHNLLSKKNLSKVDLQAQANQLNPKQSTQNEYIFYNQEVIIEIHSLSSNEEKNLEGKISLCEMLLQQI